MGNNKINKFERLTNSMVKLLFLKSLGNKSILLQDFAWTPPLKNIFFLNNTSKKDQHLTVLNKNYNTALIKKYRYSKEKTSKRIWFAKYYYVGLGYKIFIFNKALFIWVGLTHYTLLPIPDSIKIFPKKRRIYLLGHNLLELREFLKKIRSIRKMDIYKGKGLLEVKTYKSFTKMKTGKKKQY